MTTTYSGTPNQRAVKKYRDKPGQREIIKSRRNTKQESKLANLKYHTVDGWIRKTLSSAKARAAKRNLTFNLVAEDLVFPECCPIFGFKLEIGIDIKGKNISYNSPSLDRIDNTKGYTKDNVHIISNRANILKRDGDLKEFEALVKYLKGGN